MNKFILVEPKFYFFSRSITARVEMSALFNFQSLLTVIMLLICTCAYIR